MIWDVGFGISDIRGEVAGKLRDLKSAIRNPQSKMLKDIILWKYERASWQWDLLCFLIILFIFLTPKTWFDRKENLTTLNTGLTVKAKDLSPGRNGFEKLVSQENDDSAAEIIKLDKRKDIGSVIVESKEWRVER